MEIDALKKDERRIYNRHSIEEKINSHFLYEIATKVIFQKFDKWTNQVVGSPNTAFIKNMSVEGMCFTTEEPINLGDFLDLDVFLPKDIEKVKMKGEVRWVAPLSVAENYSKYDVGVQLITVNEQPVKNTIYFDENYKVEWSAVLESVFGRYRIIMQNKKKTENP